MAGQTVGGQTKLMESRNNSLPAHQALTGTLQEQKRDKAETTQPQMMYLLIGNVIIDTQVLEGIFL